MFYRINFAQAQKSHNGPKLLVMKRFTGNAHCMHDAELNIYLFSVSYCTAEAFMTAIHENTQAIMDRFS